MAYTHCSPSLRAAAASIREALNAPTPAEREAKLSLAWLKVAEALDTTAKMWHGQ
jgi:hypothetical protein